MELEHLASTLKNLQRAKQDVEDNLNRSLREKDSIINQLQLLLEGKAKDMKVSLQISISHSLSVRSVIVLVVNILSRLLFS